MVSVEDGIFIVAALALLASIAGIVAWRHKRKLRAVAAAAESVPKQTVQGIEVWGRLPDGVALVDLSYVLGMEQQVVHEAWTITNRRTDPLPQWRLHIVPYDTEDPIWANRVAMVWFDVDRHQYMISVRPAARTYPSHWGIRHEIVEHMLPHALGRGWNRDHDPTTPA